ncbi:exodeoxyribonuclease VII large subunit [Celerinatantimonas sp. MCCC 1A17872]|uniref:exodeoxyribonuclease VII large subunit n=1 Tax=Celerinatantimonas sp. MCCC 1A17872 TaxID=3177514 RepID=UPI0038C8043E
MDPLLNDPNIFSVSQLNAQVRQMLESAFSEIWLKGEISNLSKPYSGHWYFSLKDNRSQVRCAMFKGQNRKVLFDVTDGQQVLVRARISVYEPRGDYQLIVQSMQPDGLGAMQLAYEQLRSKLAAEGLFAEQNKRPLPQVIQRVGVITSASGAAFHDITAVLKRLAPSIQIVLYPSSVQGELAPSGLCQALTLANQRQEVDVIIIGRGGGSLEDLWAFNNEALARLVADSQLPIISAVGHEIDFTLTDFAADYRAPTPSAAAEKVAYGVHSLSQRYQQLHTRLSQLSGQYQHNWQQKFQYLKQRLNNQSPLRQLQVRQQQLDEYSQRLQRALSKDLQHRHQICQHLEQRMYQASPERLLGQKSVYLAQLRERLAMASNNHFKNAQNRFSRTIDQLRALSPLAVLARGYSTIQNDSGHWLTHIKQFQPDQTVTITLQDGQARAIVKSTNEQSVPNLPDSPKN